MKAFISRSIPIYQQATVYVDYLQPLYILAARYYVGWVFFAAGLTKIRDWDSTLMLFEYEYQVPFINFELAAYLGTIGELALPIMLFVGLASRFGALGLSIVNVIAVVSLEEIAPAAYNLHVIWGILLVHIALYGGGLLSADKWLKSNLSDKVPA